MTGRVCEGDGGGSEPLETHESAALNESALLVLVRQFFLESMDPSVQEERDRTQV